MVSAINSISWEMAVRDEFWSILSQRTELFCLLLLGRLCLLLVGLYCLFMVTLRLRLF